MITGTTITANERDAIRWIKAHGHDAIWHDSPHGRTLQSLLRKGLIANQGGWHVTEAGKRQIATTAVILPQKKKKRKPARFVDSLTTEQAEFSIRVATPFGEATEAVIIKIDCNGEINGDESTVATLIEMLEGARDNLLARRGRE